MFGFGDQEEEMRDHLIVKGYEVKEFINRDGDWYYFKVSTMWNGTHTVKVKDAFFGKEIKTVG
ncbi:hypothetical protein [Priestia megaterium]|uniref:hypothetical protein n=1 Tax=Priestia megaterium TaxID=1404 RepID=UPI0031FC2A4E